MLTNYSIWIKALYSLDSRKEKSPSENPMKKFKILLTHMHYARM